MLDINHFILEMGLITAEEIVAGTYSMINCSRRHTNTKIIFSRKNKSCGFFIKQLANTDPKVRNSFQQEAILYWLVDNEENYRGLKKLIPACFGYDAKNNILVLDLFQNVKTLLNYLQLYSDESTISVAAKLGQTLAQLHHQLGRDIFNSPSTSIFPKQIPWTLSMAQLPADQVTSLSEGNRQLLKEIQARSEIVSLLDYVRNYWSANAFIHGDLKPDNCLILSSSPPTTETEIKLIDWELADIGDAAWDIGTVLQAYWSFPILAGQVQSITNQFEFIEYIRSPLVAFWNSYANTASQYSGGINSSLEHCIFVGAARMMQSIYEAQTYASEMTPSGYMMLEACLQIIRQPNQFINTIFR